MKTGYSCSGVTWIVTLALLIVGMSVAPVAAQGAPPADAAIYETLDQHGRWITHPSYGEVWRPDVERDWRPYTRGQWVYTSEHGWFWQSDEPFGWVVFHYGRWFLDANEGWLWVPGNEWGPAWVAWRYGEADVGWAPLPPDAIWQDGSLKYTNSFYDAPTFSPAWCFVPIAALAAPRIYTRIFAPRRNRFYLGRTRFDTQYRVGRHGIYNGGYDAQRYRRVTGRDLVTHRIIEGTGPRRHTRNGTNIHVFRPRLTGISPSRRPGGPRTVRPPGEVRRGGVPAINRDGRRGREQRFGRDQNQRQPTGRRQPQTTNVPAPRIQPNVNVDRRRPAPEAGRPNKGPPRAINREDGRGREQRFGRGHRSTPQPRPTAQPTPRFQPPRGRAGPAPKTQFKAPPQAKRPSQGRPRQEGRKRGEQQP
ncbi:MAG: DUF6600 domain-containing protein [Hyphomicrobiaceae bacterium]